MARAAPTPSCAASCTARKACCHCISVLISCVSPKPLAAPSAAAAADLDVALSVAHVHSGALSSMTSQDACARHRWYATTQHGSDAGWHCSWQASRSVPSESGQAKSCPTTRLMASRMGRGGLSVTATLASDAALSHARHSSRDEQLRSSMTPLGSLGMVRLRVANVISSFTTIAPHSRCAKQRL